MNAHHYRDMLRRAVAAPDGQMLDLLAAKLADAERANEILQAKGYRAAGKSASAIAQMVPVASASTASKTAG
jgi:hypothetical protein